MAKKGIIITVLASMMVLCGCQCIDYCVLKGTVKGVKDGARLELQNAWDNWRIVGKTKVRNGTFEFHPWVTSTTHVYLYQGDKQLKDFFLEPGTIVVEVDADDKMDCFTGAAGTPSNDAYRESLALTGEAKKEFLDQFLASEQTGPLVLRYADYYNIWPSCQALDALERLSPELAALPRTAELKEELARRVKTEPRTEGSDFVPIYIDMEYPDAGGNPVSLASVVDNPRNRYVLLDIWATWCGPCVEDIPLLKEIYSKYHGKGLEIYSVSEDANGDRWKNFLTENGMEWINVLDDNAGRKNSKMWKSYALNGIPTQLLIDGDTGEIIARDNHLDLDAILSELLP